MISFEIKGSALKTVFLATIAGATLFTATACSVVEDSLTSAPASASAETPSNLAEQWTSMNTSPAKEAGRVRFNENTYGMFIHWGLYAQPAGVWKGERMEEGGEGPKVAEWIMRRKEIPRAEYAELATTFNPVDFDADEWAAIAKAAGMKYMVITAKHHDGFALYDSKVSEFDIIDASPFGRDIIAELEAACRKAGLAFGVYYSHGSDWQDGGDGGLKDYAPENPPRTIFANRWDPAPVTFDDYMQTKALPQVRELANNYELSQMWFDANNYTPARYSFQIYSDVYAANPEILVNSRLGSGFGDIGTPRDNEIPDNPLEGIWEGIATTNHSWGYKSYDNDWKTPTETLFWLVENVSKGGNFLLNVGPDGRGNIPPQTVENLSAVGDWLAVNGDAIYGTNAWTTTKEGPTHIAIGGGEDRREGTMQFEFESNDFWFTQKGGKIYVIALARPDDGLASVKALMGIDIDMIRLLGTGQKLDWSSDADAVNITLPTFDSEGIGYALEITPKPK
ncbi:MAG: alpha-L-fucosidase [Litorimonas sp.]